MTQVCVIMVIIYDYFGYYLKMQMRLHLLLFYIVIVIILSGWQSGNVLESYAGGYPVLISVGTPDILSEVLWFFLSPSRHISE
jgi:hypothetical protein